MLNAKSYLAIIPARGGSKRLPKKNILDLGGKPLIAWSIEAALSSKYIDKVIVSSDDKKILDIAEELGSDIIKRPDELASDTATSFDAIEHTIKNVKNYDYVIVLQPTSPLRGSKHIDDAIELLENKKADAVISVCEVEHSPLWANTLDESGSMDSFLISETHNKRSQDLPVYYRLNGAIYIINIKRLLAEKKFLLSDNCYAFKMDGHSSVDIDNDLDFLLAEIILKEKIK